MMQAGTATGMSSLDVQLMSQMMSLYKAGLLTIPGQDSAPNAKKGKAAGGTDVAIGKDSDGTYPWESDVYKKVRAVCADCIAECAAVESVPCGVRLLCNGN